MVHREAAIASDAVLVTGCSSGIGRATAERLARAGLTVYATARRPETLEPLKDLGCRTLALDVTDEASIRRAVEAVEREHGAVGVLVNNAGYAQEGVVEEVPPDMARKQFETNFFGPLLLTQLVLPAMRRRRRGRIVNVSSTGGRLTFPGGGIYHASKHALEALSDALRYELAPFGIQVAVIEPGLIATRFGGSAMEGFSPPSDSPYEDFNRMLARRFEWVYSGWLSWLSGSPERVAHAIEHAATADRPKTRYRVAGMAQPLLLTRRLLPDRAWDLLVRLLLPRPKPPA